MIVANRKVVGRDFGDAQALQEGASIGLQRMCDGLCGRGGAGGRGIGLGVETWSRAKEGQEIEIREQTLERQCDHEYIDQVRPFVGDYEVILSMACGAGVQYVAEKYRTKLVLPAVNTTFLGVTLEQGVWSERCQGCGTCILDQTGGICPIARCAKSLLNGPCGGSSNGKCEVDKEMDCGWQLIVDRLKELGQLDRYEEIIPVKDWTTSRDGGPRKRVREDLKL